MLLYRILLFLHSLFFCLARKLQIIIVDLNMSSINHIVFCHY